ncbi:hypothetical protein C8R44DRAFT_845908, partial [Mycena epipterygia]
MLFRGCLLLQWSHGHEQAFNTSCSIKPGCLYAAPACSTIPGRRVEAGGSPPAHVPYHDTTQESSSQSSSIDNEDPHTPSPQYSTTAPSHVVHDGFASLDPHFARLLSSLSLSAAIAAGGKGAGEPTLTIKTSEPVPEPSTPVPVTTSEKEDAPPVSTEIKSPP